MGFTPSPEIKKIRDIMALSQIAASHLVHVYALVLPDYHKLDMLIGLDEEIKRLVRLKEAINNVTAVFGGRALHPVSMVAGGFTKIPSKGEIGQMIKRLEGVKKDALETVKMASALRYPDLMSDAEYVAISGKDVYAVNEEDYFRFRYRYGGIRLLFFLPGRRSPLCECKEDDIEGQGDGHGRGTCKAEH
jgi:coenzyme F420-reducing hydrogenase alpha subunit